MNAVDFAAALNLFLLVVSARYRFGAKPIGFEVGPVHVRVFAGSAECNRSALYFVERATGIVRRADSWKKAGRPVGDISAPGHAWSFATPANDVEPARGSIVKKDS